MEYLPPRGGPLWMPGAARELRQSYRAPADLRLLDRARYGSQRWLKRDPNAPLAEMGRLHIGNCSAVVERLPTELATLFHGLEFTSGESERAVASLQHAADILLSVDSLAGTVGHLIEVVHLLDAPDGHDVSHSTPALPFSVFISVPRQNESDGAIRVAESLLHEAMHLQLTLLEAESSLTSSPELDAYSPWKREARPVLGILHGLYVFAVVHEALGALDDPGHDRHSYCRARRATIQDEVASLPTSPKGLSATGVALWERCRNSVLAHR